MAFNTGYSQESGKDVLDRLLEGNRRYVNGESTFPNVDKARRLDTANNGQHPKATVLACSDSRVPVEMIFDAGIGDFFVIRVAGNVCQTDEIGSIEYGLEHLETPLMIVLGHSHCGAVTVAVSGAEVHGSIPALVKNIEPVAEHINSTMKDNSLEEKVSAAVRENVFHQIEALILGSHGVAKRAREGKVLVIGAVYDIESGLVDVIGEHPDMKKLLEHAGDKPLGK
jgi:carbonic anhydrase